VCLYYEGDTPFSLPTVSGCRLPCLATLLHRKFGKALESFDELINFFTKSLDFCYAVLTVPIENAEKFSGFTDLMALLPLFFYRGSYHQGRRLHQVSSLAIKLLGLDGPFSAEAPLDFSSLIQESDRSRVWQEISAALESGNSFEVAYRLRHAQGHWLSVWERGQGVRGQNNELLGLEGYIMDITDRANEERARRLKDFESFQFSKSQSINVLASGVAHDFNNIIAGILGSAELIKMDMEEQANPSSEEFLQQIFIAGERARELIHQIKGFSQRQPAERRLVQLPPIINEAAQLVRSVIPTKLEIVYEPDKEYPDILADAAQVQQAIMSLCTHTWNIMPESKGRIEFKLALKESITGTVGQPLGLNTPHLCLSIADNGPGMSQSTQERIFEPFAQRRSNGRKNGLELFMVQEIMNAHGGKVFLESTPSKGTTFYLCFPLPA
jgi:signal transduction histidine kinase